MRALCARDLFSGMRLVMGLGIKDEVKRIGMSINKTSDLTEEMGFDLLFSILDKAISENGERQVFKFVSGLAEVPVEELEAMDPTDFLKIIIEIADVEKWKSFFSQVASLMS